MALLNSQVLQASVYWKQCADLPAKLSAGKAEAINGNIYCGGGKAAANDDDYNIYCYDPSQDNWTTLPPLPVRYFGLGQLSGKLVAIGGVKKSNDERTNDVHTYDRRSKKWKREIPSMPTATYFPGVLSIQSALVVAGGKFSISEFSDVVEIFQADTLQWYRTDALPTPCRTISLTVIANICYALGGYNGSELNQALYASIDDLICSAVPANQYTHSGSRDTQSAWKTLANTPIYRPTGAVLAGNLLAIGGNKTSTALVKKDEVYIYSHSANSWIHLSNLPAPRSGTATAVLSSMEIVVLGGWCDSFVNSVYKGILCLKL